MTDIATENINPATGAAMPPAGSLDYFLATKAIDDGTQAVGHDAFDVQEFDGALNNFTKLKETVKKASKDLATGEALARDLFFSFNKRAPRLDPNVPLKPSYTINREIMEEVMSTSEWREMRETGTAGDSLTSAMATIGAAERAVAPLGEETVKRINQLEAAEEAAARLFNQADALDDLASDADSQEQAKKLKDKAKRARAKARREQRKADAAAQALEQGREARSSAVRQAARQGLKEAIDEAEGLNQALKSFGGGYDAGVGAGSGAASSMTVKEKLELAQRVRSNPKLLMIAKLCGRFTRIALQHNRAKVKHPPDEITSITIGAEIARLLPSELALLADSDLEDLFYLRLAEGRLLQYDLIGHEPEGRGPIVVSIDGSSSMTTVMEVGGLEMTREVWAKSSMLALMAIARKEKRDFVVIHYSGGTEVVVHYFEKGQGTPMDVIATAEYFEGGGTLFEPWMEKALEIVSQAKFEKADVVAISDGIARIDPEKIAEWNRMRAARGMRAYGVLIGTDEGAQLMGEITDALMDLEDVGDDSATLKTIFSV